MARVSLVKKALMQEPERILRRLDEAALLENFFSENDFVQSAESFWNTSVRFGLICGGIGIVIGWATQQPFVYITSFGLFGFLSPACFLFFSELIASENRRREKEAMVSDLLLQASTFPHGTPTLKILKYCSKSDFGLLGKEFERCLLEISRGASIETGLGNISKRCKSRTVDRALHLIQLGYSTGCDLSDTFRQTAEDLLETGAILRERNAMLLVEKYTILFAGGLLVPAVLGLLSGMVKSLDMSDLAALEIGLDSVARTELQNAAFLATQVYIIEYGILASFFLANQEGNWKKGIVYAVFLVPVGWLVFSLAKGL